MVGFNFPPVGWASCDGQLISIAQNDVLFTLIGTTYGGDGQNTFALPNLLGRVPLHQGSGPGLSARIIGELSGSETVTLTAGQLPQHSHIPLAHSANGSQSSPQNGLWSGSAVAHYSADSPNIPMRSDLVGGVGGNQPHENMMPFVAINFIISMFGIFPSP